MPAKKPRIPKPGDKVIPRNSQAVYTVWSVSADGTEVNLEIAGTLGQIHARTAGNS